MALDGPSKVSSAERDGQTTDSVFDFLYYDSERISSFLSQFDKSGHLTSVTQNERAHRSRTKTIEKKLDGNTVLVKGSISTETEVEAEYGEDGSRTYDPRWSNALSFLDYVDEKGMVERSIRNARIGQIVLCTGDLALFDLGVLRAMWGLPTVKRAMISGMQQNDTRSENRAERRKKTSLSNKSRQDSINEAELAIEMLSVLPHSIQAAISTISLSAWSTLKEDNLTVSPSDLFMKHGLAISGEWSILGILDALPENYDDEQELSEYTYKQFSAGFNLGMLSAQMASVLVPAVRPLLGRPATSYGITPLLLFREIGSG